MADNQFWDVLSAAAKAIRLRLAVEILTLPLARRLLLHPPFTQAPSLVYTPLIGTDRHHGRALAKGTFILGGRSRDYQQPQHAWNQPVPSRRFAVLLHDFGWLHDLLASRDPDAPTLAAAHMDAWLSYYGTGNAFSWQPEITARRCLNWLSFGDKLLGDDPDGTRRRGALIMQIAYLDVLTAQAFSLGARWHMGLALVVAGALLPGAERYARRGLAFLQAQLSVQILPDGGHISRSPEAAAAMLGELVSLRIVLDASAIPVPDTIELALKRLAPMVRFFSTEDGNLASFNGGGEGRRLIPRRILHHLGVSESSFFFAPHSGYQRVEAAKSVVIMDTGRPPPVRYSQQAHAGALSLEVSTPGGRLIVNCGWAGDQPDRWRQMVRTSAAHSTLVLNDTSSAKISRQGLRRAFLGPRLLASCEPCPARVTLLDSADAGTRKDTRVEARHAGYLHRFGLLHQRQVRVRHDGGRISGEDQLYRPVNAPAVTVPDKLEAVLRFHLHPQVQVSLPRNQAQVLLVLPDGSSWRFECAGAEVELEPSVYLAAGAPPQRTRQMVVRHLVQAGAGMESASNQIKWVLEHISDG